MEAADYQETGSQQGLAFASDAVYEAAEAPGHYQAGTGGGAPHQIPLCPCSFVKAVSVSPLPDAPDPAGAWRGLRGGSRQAPAAPGRGGRVWGKGPLLLSLHGGSSGRRPLKMISLSFGNCIDVSVGRMLKSVSYL